MLTTHFDYSQLILFNPTSITATYTNPSGSPVTLAMGTLMGRVTSNNKVLPQVSTATDGSQDPIGVLVQNITVAGSATVSLTLVIAGEIEASLITFGGSDTLATAIVTGGVTLGLLGDRLASKGIFLKNANSITYRDPS